MCKWLSGKDKEAESFIKKIADNGSEIIEGDKLAQRLSEEYSQGKITQQRKILYKSRYATDGGYLDQALELLEPYSEKSFSTTIDKAEFNYRKGRILQKSGNIDASLPYFDRAISITKNQPIGFGASAALQLGYIWKDKKQDPKAINYFKIAMTYKKYEYKNSIDNKARAALSELGQ